MSVALAYSLPSLLDVLVEEALVEVGADGVVDEPLLFRGLPARLVLEHHVVVPPPLHREVRRAEQ